MRALTLFSTFRPGAKVPGHGGKEQRVAGDSLHRQGGVGKTSLSAATALSCARRGLRTIVLSTDPAHSLADVLDRTIGGERVEIEPNLSALEISVPIELSRHWGKIQTYLTQFLASQGYQEAVAEELAVLPGMEDLFLAHEALGNRRGRRARRGDHRLCADRIDAPTPQSRRRAAVVYGKNSTRSKKKIALAIKPLAEKIIKAPLPDRGVYSSVEELYRRVLRVRDMLTDPERSSIRLVTNPEKIVIQETQRAHTYLSLYGFPVDAVLVNRVLPPAAAKGFMKDWARLQKTYLERIERAFAPLPILRTPLFPTEMIGPDALVTMANEAYNSHAPDGVLWRGRPFVLSGKPGRYLMEIALPGVAKDEVDLWAKKDELIISVGDFQRNMILPRALSGHVVTKARLETGTFHVTFEKGA
ncbi:MAG: ArsA family ATPase [Deltaproteobacteria bacterium]|nr:ArsA family ATPase [Deltaproteobacteria bacterium]